MKLHNVRLARLKFNGSVGDWSKVSAYRPEGITMLVGFLAIGRAQALQTFKPLTLSEAKRMLREQRIEAGMSNTVSKAN